MDSPITGNTLGASARFENGRKIIGENNRKIIWEKQGKCSKYFDY